MVTITQVRTKPEWIRFERVPEWIHAGDRYYVPPFPGHTVRFPTPGSTFSRHGDMVGFVAWRGNTPVGRIAAIENRTHNTYYGDRTGFFGFFDFVDDREVSAALFAAAQRELAQRQLTLARGPYSPTINDECGLLTDGFDAAPMVAMPYNPRYYLEHYAALGLTDVREMFAYYIRRTQETPGRIKRIVDRVRRCTEVTIRSFNMRQLDRDLRHIHDLYNETMRRNWGFIPLSLEELRDAAGDFKAIADPDLIMFAEKGDEVVGFALTLPNVNEFLGEVRHQPRWLRTLSFAWRLYTRRPQEVRLAVLGVKPEYRNKGLGALFYAETLCRGKQKQFTGGELSWVESNNTEVIKGIEMMGAVRYKTYRIYESPVER